MVPKTRRGNSGSVWRWECSRIDAVAGGGQTTRLTFSALAVFASVFFTAFLTVALAWYRS